MADGLELIRGWFDARGWTPWAFQESAWSSFREGRSGLIHVPTGAGKTYASYMGPLSELIEEEPKPDGLRVLFVTPLRAVSRDIEKALKLPVEELGLIDRVTVESRTGDTSSSVRARQRKKLPTVLVTTPESLCLLLTQDEAREKLGGVRAVIVDEWHELLSTKRGSQMELVLARLRSFAPRMRTWALSATIANLDDAASAVAGSEEEPVLVSGEIDRPVFVESVLPREGEPFPWAGHMGLVMLPRVLEAIETDAEGLPAVSTLVFVNTRSQAERWFGAIEAARPEWRPVIGLHHGSIDKADREQIEGGLKSGEVRLVVATSSLDLGVDFAPVERVMQIGSVKGVARLMQRAGRASHRPGAPCTVTCVPTNALELVEIAAARRAIAEGEVEPRVPDVSPLDVLSQHLVTCAMGGGFRAEEMFEEVRTAWSFRDLSRTEFDWALALVEKGGETLHAYPEYHKVVLGEDGVYRVESKRIATLHRMNVGTITADAVMDIRFANGKKIGFIEETFIDKLRPGEKFVFAGRTLAYQRTRDLTAIVKPATGTTNFTPIWGGTRLPISESLSESVREALESARDGTYDATVDLELELAQLLVEPQKRLSAIPDADETLVEIGETREGAHCFVYPFEGRLVHEGLAALTALRLTRHRSATFSTAANDYGFELLTAKGYPFEELVTNALFTLDDVVEDAVDSVNVSAMAKKQFREVARISGLVPQSVPGAARSVKSVQAKSGLIYDVLEEFDPENMLLMQAKREALEKQFERTRLGRTLTRLSSGRLVVKLIARPTPLSLPLVVERMGAKLSTESLAERIEKMRAAWEK
ncbi:MAG: ligase-associated DNA damage response DEXH box helicase [Planctomycetota bacterium]